jgi:chromosome segregation ATPase
MDNLHAQLEAAQSQVETLKTENERLLIGWNDGRKDCCLSECVMERAYRIERDAQSQAAALQAELTEAKAQWAKWAGLYEHELDNCNKAESQAAAMAGLLEEARNLAVKTMNLTAKKDWDALTDRIDAALAAWKGETL